VEIVDTPSQNTQALIVLDFLSEITTNSLTEKYLGVFHKIKTVAKKFSFQGGVLMTVQDSGGYFGVKNKLTLRQAQLAGLTGIVKTASLEWPLAECKAIDINCTHQSTEMLAEMLFNEFVYYYHDKEKEIGLPFENTRIKLETHIENNVPSSLNSLKKNSVIIVTGGARGITAACIIALAKKQACRFVLLGRSEVVEEPEFCKNISDLKQLKSVLVQQFMKEPGMNPKKIEQLYRTILANREINHTVSTLNQGGSQAWYLSVDINQKGLLSSVLESVRKKWGSIHGIIHGAGVLADKLIIDKTEEQFKTVFETKVAGLQHLLELTAQDKLSYLYLFSSVAGRYGNVGQADYAAANEVLNKIAQYEFHHRKSCHVKSLNWAPWESGMVDEKLMKMFSEKNIPILSIDEGTTYFTSEILKDDPHSAEIEIIYGSLNASQDKKNNHHKILITVNSTEDIYLKSHVIKNKVVVPACLVLDWFMRSIEGSQMTCKNFKILKGIQLDKDPQHESFHVQVEQFEKQYHMKLLDSEDKVRYTAEFVESKPVVENKLPSLQGVCKPWPWKLEEIYHAHHPEGPLFHGEYFQAIKKLLSFSTTGGSAILHSYHSMAKQHSRHWPKENWKSDILALDGALQLLLLWTKTAIGKTSLPVGFEEVVLVQSPLPTQELHCEFDSQALDNYRSKSNIYLYDQHHSLYAKLTGVEMCAIH
jgi:NAD(P)-dependent dehydrogenase (short-subunit alcohol dehydrogenase family)